MDPVLENHTQTRNQPRPRPHRRPLIRIDDTRIDVTRMRLGVKTRVEQAIQGTFGRKYTVEFFGSTRYGVSHLDSDLDMVVIDPDAPEGWNHASSKPPHKISRKYLPAPIYNIRRLASCLSYAGFKISEHRISTSVPIVKFTDRITGLECDLNVNERLGIANSDLIKHYCDISPVLRPMLFSIKEWAKPLQLNSPSTPRVSASFSSYAFALMTIGFLQAQGQLPNLQANLPPLAAGEIPAIWTRKPHRRWEVRYRMEPGWTSPECRLDEVLQKWFHFWATFPYTEKCLDIRLGGIVDRVEREDQTSSVGNPIIVPDPFILTKNVSRDVSKKVVELFKEECVKQADKFSSS
ncbi:hypothetical protein M413DRAFT_443561 [Hebeloma cylindrosporum]|uniref:Poly(A) RNA polymerase mitochondrial-like central palm domain-containing protein n=1 Tax=Hebeloma cylindrosporum TaxID=76867 RepID=A0A0C3C477_HEBCY|nr:hypothetical protein M413DRAFT_443561 [Hebeloma cylindrosporum h7]